MSSSDLLSLVSLVVSAFAFFVSLLTYVYTVALGPRLEILVGETIELHYTADYKLCMISYFAFFNGGAQSGAIVKVSGRISPTDRSRNATVYWDSFVEDKDIADTESKHAGKLWYSTESTAYTLVVTGRGVGGTVAKRIGFITDEEYTLHPGKYVLELKGLVGPKLTRWCKAKGNLEISREDVQYLGREECREDAEGNYQASLLLSRKEFSKRSWISGLFRLVDPTFISQRQNPSSKPPTP